MCNNCEFSDSNDSFIERLKNVATNLNNEKVDLIHQEKREELKLNKLLQSKASLQGPVQKKFEESKKSIKIKELSHFNDEAMNGNSANLIFDDFRAGKNTLISCFIDYPEVYQLFLKFFIILTNIDTLLCKSGEKTLEQREQTAQACEELGKFFPVNFKRPLTRKLHILSYVAPQQIRND